MVVLHLHVLRSGRVERLWLLVDQRLTRMSGCVQGSEPLAGWDWWFTCTELRAVQRSAVQRSIWDVSGAHFSGVLW